jgi:voltage-dependent potassium channel beta subunit
MGETTMTYRRVGASGLVTSEIGLGSWLTYGGPVDEKTATSCIRRAREAGVTLFDTADVYSRGEAERVLGRVLGGERRSELVITTKAYFAMSENPNDRGLSRKHLFESIHGSLERLRTDYVDIFQCHRFDPSTPIGETVRAMDDIVRAGNALYWGVSCWTRDQIEEALRVADALNAVRPISNQPPYNMFDREIEDEVLPFCVEQGIGQLAFSPLAEGILTGKYADGRIPPDSRAADETDGQFLRPRINEENLARVERLRKLADEAGLSLPRMALAWALRQPGVSSVIVGATRPDQVRENVRAAGVTLDDSLLREIEMVLSGS